MNQSIVKIHTTSPQQPHESDDLKDRLCDLTESLDTQRRALSAISCLLNGHNDTSTVNVSELGYLLDPIIDQLELIQTEFSGVFFGGDFLISAGKGDSANGGP